MTGRFVKIYNTILKIACYKRFWILCTIFKIFVLTVRHTAIHCRDFKHAGQVKSYSDFRLKNHLAKIHVRWAKKKTNFCDYSRKVRYRRGLVRPNRSIIDCTRRKCYICGTTSARRGGGGGNARNALRSPSLPVTNWREKRQLRWVGWGRGRHYYEYENPRDLLAVE